MTNFANKRNAIFSAHGIVRQSLVRSPDGSEPVGIPFLWSRHAYVNIGTSIHASQNPPLPPCENPANLRRLTNAEWMLAQRRRRCANFTPALVQHLVAAMKELYTKIQIESSIHFWSRRKWAVRRNSHLVRPVDIHRSQQMEEADNYCVHVHI